MRVNGLTATPPGGSRHFTRYAEMVLVPTQRPQAIGAANFDGRILPFGGWNDNARDALLLIQSVNNGAGGPNGQVVSYGGINYLVLAAPASGNVGNIGNEYGVFFGGAANNILGQGFTLHTAPAARVGGSLYTPSLLAVVVEGLFRKVDAGDIIPSATMFGFRTLSPLNGANPTMAASYLNGGTPLQAMMGFGGDGLGGLRFQSWHCPGPDSPAGQEVVTYADPGSVTQPAALVAPGTAECHVRLKYIPALSAAQPGQVLCYLEGQLVATFAANFPNGFAVPGLWAASNKTVSSQIAARYLRFWLDEDLSASF